MHYASSRATVEPQLQLEPAGTMDLIRIFFYLLFHLCQIPFNTEGGEEETKGLS